MAYSDVAIDVTAKQIEDAVKAVPELQEADETAVERLDGLDQQMSQKVDYSAFRSNVEQLQTQIDNKQEKLVAGNGIEIDGNVISALLDIAGTQGIEVLDSIDEYDNPIKLIKLTEETYNLIQQISNKENKLLSTDSNIELFDTTDEFGNNVTGIQFGEQAKNVVEKFGDLEEQVENKADKKNWKLIQTIKCDGTKSNYNKSGLNLSALKVVCSTEVGEKNLNGRLNINNIVVAFFSNYVATSKKHMFATVDLNNLSVQKGIGTTNTEVTATENITVVDDMLSMESITSYDFGSYSNTQYIPSNSVIEIYGKEK